jgi:hypothetical protein
MAQSLGLTHHERRKSFAATTGRRKNCVAAIVAVPLRLDLIDQGTAMQTGTTAGTDSWRPRPGGYGSVSIRVRKTS